MAEKGLCRARDETTICRAAIDTAMGSRFATPVGADLPFARREVRTSNQDRETFCSKVSSSKHTQICVLPWTAPAFAVLPLHQGTREGFQLVYLEQTQEWSGISGPSPLRDSPCPWILLETSTWTQKIQNYKMQTRLWSGGRAKTYLVKPCRIRDRSSGLRCTEPSCCLVASQ